MIQDFGIQIVLDSLLHQPSLTYNVFICLTIKKKKKLTYLPKLQKW